MNPDFMARARELAERGRFNVEPNPEVGAVVVSRGQVVAEGWHDAFGGPHAEEAALRAAGDHARGAELYVSLEPCSTHGKRPPCIDAIMRSGISRVWVGELDPSEVHRNRGVSALREAGIQVDLDPSTQDSSPILLGRFQKHLESDRSYVIAKWAMTLDGKIATESKDSKWISSETSRIEVHRQRDLADGVAVGVGTAVSDDPALTCRSPEPLFRGQPNRIVFDPTGSLPLSTQLVRDASHFKTQVLTTPRGEVSLKEHRRVGVQVEVVEVAHEESFELAGLRRLRELGCHRLLVEGGRGLLTALFENDCIDQMMVFIAPKLVGGARAITPLGGRGYSDMNEAILLENAVTTTIGEDAMMRGFVGSRR